MDERYFCVFAHPKKKLKKTGALVGSWRDTREDRWLAFIVLRTLIRSSGARRFAAMDHDMLQRLWGSLGLGASPGASEVFGELGIRDPSEEPDVLDEPSASLLGVVKSDIEPSVEEGVELGTTDDFATFCQ